MCSVPAEATREPAVDVNVLHAKIGELTLEDEFLEGALSKAGLLSAKRRSIESRSADHPAGGSFEDQP